MFPARIRLRRRMLDGVTSTSSSSLMNSMACSSPSLRGGMRRIASSADDARMLVCFFSFVDRRAGVDEDLTALLEIEDRVGGGDARAVGDERAVRSRRNRAVPWLPAREDVVHDARPLRVGHELRAEADEAARGDA